MEKRKVTIPETESKIQQDCVIWFTNTYCLKSDEDRKLIYAVPNGGKRDAREAMRLRNEGLLSGASDIVLDFGFTVVYCEMKAPEVRGHKNGGMSDAQVEFRERVWKMKRQYWLCYSLEEFQMNVRVLMLSRKK